MNGSTTTMRQACPTQRALHYLDAFLEATMCGRCFPCALGCYEARARLETLARGEGTAEDVDTLERIASMVLEGSRCRKGKDAARFLAEAVADSRLEEHAAGICREEECRPLLTYAVVPESCVRCGACREVCTHGAVVGEARERFRGGYPAFEIRQARCHRCGECAAACEAGAIRTRPLHLSSERGDGHVR
jgi:ferredoxin